MRVRTQSFIFSIRKKIMRLKGLNMKLEAKNLGFCINFFNYVALFVQTIFNASASYMPVYTVFLFTLSYCILNQLLFFI